MNPTPLCIPLLIVKRLCPSLIKLFSGLTKQTIRKKNYLKKLPKFSYCLLFANLVKKKCDFNEFMNKLLPKLRVEYLL